MDEREQSALRHDTINVFLLPGELATVICCLGWVMKDMKMADWELSTLIKPNVQLLKDAIPKEAFTVALPLVQKVTERVLIESVACFTERNNEQGKKHLDDEISKLEKTFDNIMQLRNHVSMGTFLQTLPEHQSKK